MGYDVTMIASLVSKDAEGVPCLLEKGSTYYTPEGCKVIRLDYKKGLLKKLYRRLRIYNHTYSTLQKEKPDLIFCHGLSFCDARVVVRYLKKNPIVKLYCDSHSDYINSARTPIKMLVNRTIWRHCAQILEPYSTKIYGVTPIRCQFLKDMYHISAEKIEYLPLGIDDENIPSDFHSIRKRIGDRLKIEPDSFIIVTGGKLDKRKRIDHLLSIQCNLDNRVHIIVFGMITPEMKEALKPYQNNSNIHFVGWCNADEVMQYLSCADLCCFPGTHSTLWEQSVGLGKPCVFKKWEGMTQVDVNGNCIFIKGEDDNDDELQNVIQSLIFTDKYYKLKNLSKDAAKYFRYSVIAKKSIGIS